MKTNESHRLTGIDSTRRALKMLKNSNQRIISMLRTQNPTCDVSKYSTMVSTCQKLLNYRFIPNPPKSGV